MTWNFPTAMLRDLGPGATRNERGLISACGPGAKTELGFNDFITQPFSTGMTCIFSFFYRTGWSNTAGAKETLFSIGVNSATENGFLIQTDTVSSNKSLVIKVWDNTAGTMRYSVLLGDEDGTNWLQADKWYQVGFSFNSTKMSFAVNGVTTPKRTIVTDAAGSIDVSTGQDRCFLHAPQATTNVTENVISTINIEWPTPVIGPAAYATQVLDFDTTADRARVWDGNGDFKNPGEDGSLWFDDTFAAKEPDWYHSNGFLRREPNGKAEQLWNHHTQVWMASVPSGLRKAYE